MDLKDSENYKSLEDNLFNIILNAYSTFDLLPHSNENIFENLKNLTKNNKDKALEFSQNINKNLAISLIIWFFSDFKYYANYLLKGEEESTQNWESLIRKPNKILFQLVNEVLVNVNSRFIITETLDRKEFINFAFYFLLEFDVIGDLIDKINKIFKNFILINYESLFKIHIDAKNINIDNSSKLKNTKSDSKDGFVYQNFLEFFDTNKIKEIYKNLSDKDDLRSLFNKMNMALKSLKRQTDNFINLSYKLSELVKNQEKPLNTLKIEEILLFNDDIYQNYKSNITFLQIQIEKKLAFIENLLDVFDHNLHNYEAFVVDKSFQNLNINFNEQITNIEVQKTKEIFKARLSELLASQGKQANADSNKKSNNKANSEGSGQIYFLDFIKEWVENLYDNLTGKMNSLKQIKIFNKPEITEYLSSLVIDLEKYFNSEINSVLEGNTQFDNFAKIKGNFNLLRTLLYNTFKDKRDFSNYGNLKVLEKKLSMMINKNKHLPDKKLRGNAQGANNAFGNEDEKKSEFPTTIFSLISQNYEKYLELKDQELLKKIFEDTKKKNLDIVDSNVAKMKIIYKIYNYLTPFDNSN